MKKTLLVFLLSFLLLSSNVVAQNWLTGGNALAANGTLGSTTNFSVLFKSNNSERGRLTNAGLWGFGTTAPNSKVHINSASGQVPLRVQVNASTKFLVNSGGGVSIGSGTTAPTNGLYVSGNVGIGTSSPENKLHISRGSAGTVTGWSQAALIVEGPTDNYINILAPDAAGTGILFGKPANNISGGIIYNNVAAGNPNGFDFRTNGNITKMVFTNEGNLGVGTVSPAPFKTKITHSDYGLDIENAASGNDWELHTTSTGELQLHSNGNFSGSFNKTSGVYTPISDERLKTNIKPMSAMLEKIKQLKPSTYQFKNATDQQEYNGFIAQEVMKLFPNMVVHNVDPQRKLDIYTMDYGGFGILAIKGIQELVPVVEEQKIVNEEQKQEIATLKDRIDKLEAALQSLTANNGNVSTIITKASLEQNNPNPFTKNTVIRYSIPQGSKGQISIHDQAGKLVKMLNAKPGGQSQVSGNDLAAGTYTYTLMIDGKVALSKQMLIIK